MSPYSLTIDYYYQLYVADYNNNRIQKFMKDSSVGSTVAGQADGTGGATLDSLMFPTAVIIDSGGNMYIADKGNSRIQFWPNGASSGTNILGNGK
jgi:hypothetical protein